MNYTITLKYGAFFFAGDVTIAGTGNSITVKADELDRNTIKAINAAQASGVIDSDVPIYVEETSEAHIFIESEVVEETAVEVESNEEEVPAQEETEVTKKTTGRKNKRG